MIAPEYVQRSGDHAIPHLAIANRRRWADSLLDLLVDVGPLNRSDACAKLGWPSSRFDATIRFARAQVCPELGLTIPAAVPPLFLYQVTTEWEPVELGASWSLGHVDSRLAGILRDVDTILPHLTRGTKEWRRANFLSKRLAHLLSTLAEIDHA